LIRPASIPLKYSIITGTFIVLAAWKTVSGFNENEAPPPTSANTTPTVAPWTSLIREATLVFTSCAVTVCAAMSITKRARITMFAI
jgi:hypothetical protein